MNIEKIEYKPGSYYDLVTGIEEFSERDFGFGMMVAMPYAESYACRMPHKAGEADLHAFRHGARLYPVLKPFQELLQRHGMRLDRGLGEYAVHQEERTYNGALLHAFDTGYATHYPRTCWEVDHIQLSEDWEGIKLS